jgi:parvulin-like peptidyl-prolyl isomerase
MTDMQASEEETTSPEKPSFFKTKKFRIIAGVVLVFAMLGLTTQQVYSRPATDTFVRIVTKVFPFPAVSVNGHIISMADYLLEYDALLNSFAASAPEGTALPSEAELEEAIMQTLINKLAIRQLASSSEIEIDQERIDEYYEEIVTAQGGEESFAVELSETFGWNVGQFKERIIRSIVLALQMTDFVESDEDLQEEREALIKDAFERLQDGEDFRVVAKEVHGAVDPNVNSDLGYVQLSVIPSTWADAVETLPVDAHSPIQYLDEGYAIFKVLDRIVAGEDMQLHLMVITVPKKTLEDVVKEYLEKAEIKRYL